MLQHPDHLDAEILLRLYDLRREERLRRAREWFIREFHADSPEDLEQRYPFGTEENDFCRMMVSYWDMAASIVNHGLINEDLFFENNGEFWIVWQKVKPLVPRSRELMKNPLLYKNLEEIGEKYEKWMEKRAPGALAIRRERLKTLRARPA